MCVCQRRFVPTTRGTWLSIRVVTTTWMQYHWSLWRYKQFFCALKLESTSVVEQTTGKFHTLLQHLAILSLLKFKLYFARINIKCHHVNNAIKSPSRFDLLIPSLPCCASKFCYLCCGTGCWGWIISIEYLCTYFNRLCLYSIYET